MKGLLEGYDKDLELRRQPSDDLQSSNWRSATWGARMPISGERRFVKASGRIGLWFSSLVAAGLLFSVLFSLLSGGAGSILSIFLIFRVTMTFAFPVGCLYLPVLLAFRNREEKRMPIILLGGILIGPASMAPWGLVLKWRGLDAHMIWYGDPLIGIGGFAAILFAWIVGSLTTLFYYCWLRATRHRRYR
jgi:hypothetical protein